MLVTGGTGSVMLVIWFFCRLFLQKWNPDLVYYMLRWVVIMFLLPITYVAIVCNYKSGYILEAGGISKMMFVLNAKTILFHGFAAIWIASAIVVSIIFLKSEILQRRICRMNFDDGGSYIQSEFERIKEVLGIKGKVLLLRNDNPRLKSPFVCGLLERKVVIPYVDYHPLEVKVMLYHELSHIKKRDVLFRYLTMLALVFNSINPFAYVLLSQVTNWSEADCDARAIEALEREGIEKKRYYSIIWKMMTADLDKRILFTFPMLHGKRNSMYRRVKFMEKYRINLKKATKPVTMALVITFALLSSVTAYGAGMKIAGATDNLLKSTQVVGQYDMSAQLESWSDEKLIPPSDVPDIIYSEDEIALFGEGNINWDVPAGTRYVTKSIYMKEGTVVSIACTARPSDCTYWFGLMYASSECAVVEGSGSGAYDFTVPSNGYYRIMVENRSSQEIHVGGYYQY